MKMAKAFILIFSLLVFIPSQQAQENPFYPLPCLTDLNVLLDNYWVLQQKQEKLFMDLSIDENGELLSDGIGEWDEEGCVFSEAGKNIPGTIIIQRQDTEEFQLHFGDSGLKIGDQLVTYALEYDLLMGNNQTLAAEKTLNKIFLLLQAIRRLDMTANKYMQMYYENCDPDACPDFHANLSGYTGFMLREDVPFNLNVDCGGLDGCPTQGVSGLAGFQVDIKNSDCFDEENLDSHNQQCDIICCFPIWKVKTGNGNISSQDQLIGILHGLLFVAEYVPRTATVSVKGQTFNIRDIVDNIALAINEQSRSCSNRIKYPGCVDPCDSENIGLGDNTAYFYKGIAETVSRITGEYIHISNGNSLSWSAGNYVMFKDEVDISLGYIDVGIDLTGKKNVRFNKRMYLYLKLGSDDLDGNNSTIFGDVPQTSLWNLPFEDYILNGDLDVFDGEGRTYRDEYICSIIEGLKVIGCDVPCADIDSLCNDQHIREYEQNGIANPFPFPLIKWCAGANALHNNSYDEECELRPGFQSPIAYMHLMTLLVKSDIIPVEKFINPNYVGNTEDQIYLDVPDNICSDATLEIPIQIDEDNYQVEVSDNLSYSIDQNENLIINPKGEVGIENDAWIKIIVPSEDECVAEKVYYYELGIHDNNYELSTTFDVNSEDCSIDVIARSWGTLPNYEIQITNYSVSPQYLNSLTWFTATVDNNVLHIDFNESLQDIIEFPEYISYSITIIDPCGNQQIINSLVYLPDCSDEDDPIFIISPNPTNTNSGPVRIKIRSNQIRSGNVYVQNARGVTQLRSNYTSSSSSTDIFIDSNVFDLGTNFIIFTDESTFSYNEPLIITR